MRKIHKERPHLFKPYEWEVRETEFSEDTNLRNETVFSLGNGYMGMRGTFEEGFYSNPKNTAIGTFINGVYEYREYKFMWKRPGFPDRTHSMINIANPALISLEVDGENFKLSKKSVREYIRILDLKNGILKRRLIWKTFNGKEIEINIERFLSLDDNHLMAFKYSVRPINFSGKIKIISSIDGHVENVVAKKPEIGSLEGVPTYIAKKGTQRDIGFIEQNTRKSDFQIVCAMNNTIKGQLKEALFEIMEDKTKEIHQFTVEIEKGKECILEKCVSLYSSKEVKKEELLPKSILKIDNATKKGYEKLKEKHVLKLKEFWNVADIEIKGDISLQQAVRFNAFHLLQSAGKDGKTNISANGLTGEGYQGHTFWDTEMYMLPIFLYTKPEIAKNLLMYRYNILDKAKERARQMDNQGALFSWNSITGEECGFVFEAATAQYHINCDICYAIYKYLEATEDEEFLVNYGARILFETTKCMAHRGSFIKYKDNKFCINVVCGPDEYTPVVDNNCYTNVLTKFELGFALETAKMLEEKYPMKYKELCSEVGIDDIELKLWRDAKNNMYIPYNKELDLLMQDDQYLYRDPIDIDEIPLEKLPLLTNLHPLNLWRYQVSKQADIVLLMFVRSHEYSKEMKKKVYDFYEPKTIHDSSLSASVHSIVANDIGYFDEAYNYFMQAARMDLDDYNRNTSQGVHSACMGGTLMGIINGFAGMRTYYDKLHFNPYVPKKWDGYSFKVNFKGRIIDIDVDKESVNYTLISGENIEIDNCNKSIKLFKDKTVKTKLREVDI